MYCVFIELQKHGWKFGRKRNAVGTGAACRRVFPQLFRVLPNSIETRRTCFLFLLESTATKKGKLPVNFDYQSENSLCSRHHYVNSSCQFCVSIELQKHIFNQSARVFSQVCFLKVSGVPYQLLHSGCRAERKSSRLTFHVFFFLRVTGYELLKALSVFLLHCSEAMTDRYMKAKRNSAQWYKRKMSKYSKTPKNVLKSTGQFFCSMTITWKYSTPSPSTSVSPHNCSRGWWVKGGRWNPVKFNSKRHSKTIFH